MREAMFDKLNLILSYIMVYVAKNGYSPTIREIRDGCAISSTSLVYYYLEKLHDNGDIKRDRGISRSIVIPKNKAVTQ